jgi:hypothetical protein
VDLSKLTTADKVIAGSGIALFIFSFFPWFGFDIPFGGDYTESAWDDFLPILAVLLAIALVVLLLLVKFSSVRLPQLPLPLNQIFLIGGVIVFALLLLKLLIGGEESGVDLDRRIGVFLGVLAGAGMAVGGWLKSQEPAEAGTTGPGTTPPTPF